MAAREQAVFMLILNSAVCLITRSTASGVSISRSGVMFGVMRKPLTPIADYWRGDYPVLGEGRAQQPGHSGEIDSRQPARLSRIETGQQAHALLTFKPPSGGTGASPPPCARDAFVKRQRFANRQMAGCRMRADSSNLRMSLSTTHLRPLTARAL